MNTRLSKYFQPISTWRTFRTLHHWQSSDKWVPIEMSRYRQLTYYRKHDTLKVVGQIVQTVKHCFEPATSRNISSFIQKLHSREIASLRGSG